MTSLKVFLSAGCTHLTHISDGHNIALSVFYTASKISDEWPRPKSCERFLLQFNMRNKIVKKELFVLCTQ